MEQTKILLVASIILFLTLSFFLLRRDRERERELDKILEVAEQALAGNLNARVLTSGRGRAGQLAFKLNQLVESMQELKVETIRWKKSQKRLLTNISHDIRTPLTSILGYVEALRDGIVKEPLEEQEYLQIVADKSQSLKTLIDDIFHLAKLDANELPMDFQKQDLNELLRQCLIGFLPQLKAQQLELLVDIPEESYWIRADSRSILRIFENIIKNSLQHGGAGGVLGIQAAKKEDHYLVEIWDRGSGIPEHQQSQIFERLFKGDSSRKRLGDSSGLGLAIAKELLEVHQGKISVSSVPGERTSFIVLLPSWNSPLSSRVELRNM